MARWWRYMEHQGADRAAPMRPQVPASALSALLADDAILCGDAGTVAYWIARNVALRGEQRFSLSGVHCTMGSGLSYAIGAQCAYPGRQVVAFVGDGATAMLLGDLMTLRQHRLPVKLVMIRNNSVVLERWEQIGFLGNAEFGNDLSDADFAKIAEGCGISSVRIDDASRCREQLAAALSSPEPVLVECIVDPDEPALETPLVGKHAEKYAQAFRQGGEAEKRAGRALLERLREEKQFLPEAIDAPTAELMKALEAG
jgi:pyruvate dehydrogenase (quinone)/pyruvate oxidase